MKATYPVLGVSVLHKIEVNVSQCNLIYSNYVHIQTGYFLKKKLKLALRKFQVTQLVSLFCKQKKLENRLHLMSYKLNIYYNFV